MSTTTYTATTALVSLSLNGDIYCLPTSMVQPCVDMFVAMDRTFTNVVSKQSEKGLVWTYVAEATKGRRLSNTFLDLYVNVDTYPVYGLGGVSRTVFASSVALTANTSQATLTGSRHAMDHSTKAKAVGGHVETKKVSLHVSGADTQIAPRGGCNDPTHSTTIADMAQAILELDELKLANEKLTARIEGLIPKWMGLKLNDLEQDVIYVEKGVDALDLDCVGSQNVQGAIHLDEETNSLDPIAELVPEPVGDSLDFIIPPLPTPCVLPSSSPTPCWDLHAPASGTPEKSYWNLHVPRPSAEEVQPHPQPQTENKNKNEEETVMEVPVEQDDLTRPASLLAYLPPSSSISSNMGKVDAGVPTFARATRTRTSISTSTSTSTTASTSLRAFHARIRQRDAERAAAYATIDKALRRIREISEEGRRDLRRVHGDSTSGMGRRGAIGGSVLVLKGAGSPLEPRDGGKKAWPGIHEVLEGAEGVVMGGFGEVSVGRRGEDERCGRDEEVEGEKEEAKDDEGEACCAGNRGVEKEGESVEVEVEAWCGEKEKMHQEPAEEETQVRCIVPVSVTVELSFIDEHPELRFNPNVEKTFDNTPDLDPASIPIDADTDDTRIAFQLNCAIDHTDRGVEEAELEGKSEEPCDLDASKSHDDDAAKTSPEPDLSHEGDCHAGRLDTFALEDLLSRFRVIVDPPPKAMSAGPGAVDADVDAEGDREDSVLFEHAEGGGAVEKLKDKRVGGDGDGGVGVRDDSTTGRPTQMDQNAGDREQVDDGNDPGEPYNLKTNPEEPVVKQKSGGSKPKAGDDIDIRDNRYSLGVRGSNEQVPSPIKSGFQAVLRDVGAAKATLRKLRSCGACEGQPSSSVTPLTPARPTSRRPLSTLSSTPPAETIPAGKKRHSGVSAIVGFNTTSPELLERKGTLTRIHAPKHPRSPMKTGIQLPKLRGTGRLSNGTWKPASEEKNARATPPGTAFGRGLRGEGARMVRVPGRDRTNEGMGTPTRKSAVGKEVQDLTLLMPKAVSVQFYSRKR